MSDTTLKYAKKLISTKGRCSSDPRAHELASALIEATKYAEKLKAAARTVIRSRAGESTIEGSDIFALARAIHGEAESVHSQCNPQEGK